MEYKTVTSEDMENVGKKIAQTLTGGDIILLYGELGAGKTTLTKGIAKELGIKNTITSPSFTLMNVYNIKTSKHQNIKTLVHIDTYRLENEQELIDIGIEDYLGKKDTLCIIEWPDKIEDLLKDKKVKRVSIEHTNGDGRKLKIT